MDVVSIKACSITHMDVMTWLDGIFLRDTICDDIASFFHPTHVIGVMQEESIKDFYASL
jgi:hypothetical protein